MLSRGCILGFIGVSNVSGPSQFDGRDASLQYRHLIVSLGCERELFWHTQHVAVQPNGAVEIVRFDDQTELFGKSCVSHAAQSGP